MTSPTGGTGPTELFAAATDLAKAAAERLAPAQAAEPSAPASTLRPDLQASHLARFSTEAQSAVKWLLTALAATATLVFGAGPVLKPTGLSLEDDAGQLVVAGLFAVVGLLSVGAIIVSASRVFLTEAIDVHSLTSDVVTAVQASPDRFFPALLQPKTVAAFADALREKRKAYIREVTELREHELAVAKARAAGDPRAAEAENKLLDSVKVEVPSALNELELYENKRDLIVAFAEAEQKRTIWKKVRTTLYRAGPLAVIGGVGFQLVLSTPSDPGAAADPVPTTMTPLDNTGATVLWTQLGLASCELPEAPTGREGLAARTVPVVLLGGAGSAADPWRVQTVPTSPLCVARTFEVTRDVVTVVVVVPEEVSIEYTRAPEPSPSTGT
ncbi:hypothetical protein [Cellulomonas dongxiuzhuiae]|uniref:hypothetical protein n=1 Tax=Cellulomonas dongxiuzhuiae TaxID=2819979 RepID=UPI001AAE39A1|nr:hypothetical protein [Cellulomonas dongxiuzhuiae]MBO3087124.1 hypothetical protein [Cellulomonas dongxiuzhuiae]